MTDEKYVTAGVSSLVRKFDNFLQIPENEFNRNTSTLNKYDVYRKMELFDSEIASALTRISAVVTKAYDQPAIMEDGNADLLEDVKNIMGEIKFNALLPAIVSLTSRDGDCILVPVKNYKRGNPLKILSEGLEIVPLNITTIIDKNVDERMVTQKVIRSREKYLLNESYHKMGTTNMAEYKGEHVCHISLNYRGNWVTDIYNRNTFGIWGTSPLESLIDMVRWKYQSIRDDVAWRHANVPRIDHSLDLGSVLDLNEYSGSVDERINAAQNAAQNIVSTYKSNLENSDDSDNEMDVDQGFIHDNNTKVQQIGGNNTYADCLNIVKKVDMSIATRLGIPLSALGYESNSSYAIGKVTVTFMNTFGLQLLASIQDGIFDFIKRVLAARGTTYSDEDWNKIYLNYNVTDFAELAELIDAWTTAFKHGLCVRKEGREHIGLNPLGDEELDNQFYPNLMSMINDGQSPKDIKTDDAEEKLKQLDEGGDPAFYL